MKHLRLIPFVATASAACLLLVGCGFKLGEDKPTNNTSTVVRSAGNGNDDVRTSGDDVESRRLQGATFHDPTSALASNAPIALRAARNETVDFAIQLNDFPEIKPKDKRQYALRLNPLKLGPSAISPQSFKAYQVLPMPVDTNQAAFVRHTGLLAASRQLPRALVPLVTDNGTLALSLFRNPADATNASSAPPRASSVLVWVDVQLPPTVPPGEYAGSVELLDDGKAIASLPIKLTVHDFVLPDERHLHMVGLLDWDALVRLYPQQFQKVTPSLLGRKDPRQAATVKVLDDLVKLAQSHRTTVIVPRLQPTVKWPAGRPVLIDWTEFDSLVTPWLKGEMFEDLVPLGHWPLPAIDNLHLHATSSRLEYWKSAAGHFDGMDWLSRSSVAMEQRSGSGAVSAADAVWLSERAAEVLSVHPRVRVTVPMTEEQILLATPDAPGRIPNDALERLMYTAPGLIASQPLQRLPEGIGTRWLRTDLPGVVPHVGAGADEREARLWSWLAFFRRASLIRWPGVLPATDGAKEPAAPDQLVWFYPGHWFGIDQPVPTLQLKWMRRAQQDYEYLWLARQRGQFARSLLLSRLMTRPVEIQPTQTPDAAYALLSGTTDPRAWTDALELATRTILVSQPGQTVDPAEEKQLIYRITAWSRTQERPMLLGKSVNWYMRPGGVRGSRWIDLALDVDIYNAAELQPQRSALAWKSVPEAWQAPRDPVPVPQLGTYSVNRFVMHASVNLDRVKATSRQPVQIGFTEGFSARPFGMQLMLPVGTSDQRLSAPPKIDGSLEDWFAEDALHEGHMVRMLSRPAIQQQELPLAEKPSAIYSTWGPASLFLAFRVEGADMPLTNAAGNTVEYQMGRAWGSDVCELMLQPIYEDGSVGPLLYATVKRGSINVRRRSDPRLSANPWEAMVNAEVSYEEIRSADVWRAELSIPWETINDFSHRGQRPAMLRFNFAQHRGRISESSSWAGPVDYLRDEQFMGLLEIRPARE